MSISGWRKRRASKKRAKHDLERIDAALGFISHSSRMVADMGAQSKKRYALGNDRADYDDMVIADKAVAQLKSVYAGFYAMRPRKIEQKKGREPLPLELKKKSAAINGERTKGPVIKLKAKGAQKNG